MGFAALGAAIAALFGRLRNRDDHADPASSSDADS